MVITRKRRAKIRVRPAGIGHIRVIIAGSQSLQAFARLICIPLCRQHLVARAGLAPAPCEAPIFHGHNAVGVDTLEPTICRNHSFGQKLGAPPLGDIGGAWRASGLIIQNREPTLNKAVDPVGARGKGHWPGRRRNFDLPGDFGIALLQTLTTTGLGLNEPCRHRFKGGPPEKPDRGDGPVRIEQPARDCQQFIQCGLRQRTARKGFHESRQRIMHKIATERRIDWPINIVKLAQRKYPARIKAVGVGNPVIDFGGRELPRPRRDGRCRARPGARHHRRNRRQGQKAVTKPPAIIDSGLDPERGKNSAKPLQPAAWRCHGILVPERPRDNHLRRTDSHPDIMGAEPGAPIMRRQACSLAHFGIHPRVDFRAWWP